MPDRRSRDQRSWNMSQIKGKDTSIEIMVRKYLFSKGFRYRKNVDYLPGKPDIYLPKYRTAIFVNGCFWHHHYKCKLAYVPKTRSEYQLNKFERNIENDLSNQKLLSQMDIQVITVWECEIKECFEFRMEELIKEIKEATNVNA